jgi:putative transposase
LVEADGGPLSVVVAAANVHDCKLLQETLGSIVVTRPQPTLMHPQHLCLDQGYNNPTGRQAAEAYGAQVHLSHRRMEAVPPAEATAHPARRWVVERTLAWLSKCRALLIRYDKKPANFLGLLQLACALLWFR